MPIALRPSQKPPNGKPLKGKLLAPLIAYDVRQRLSGEDMETMNESGLTEETWTANRLQSEGGPKHGGLIIPYRDLSGKLTGFYRKRPYTPKTASP